MKPIERNDAAPQEGRGVRQERRDVDEHRDRCLGTELDPRAIEHYTVLQYVPAQPSLQLDAVLLQKVSLNGALAHAATSDVSEAVLKMKSARIRRLFVLGRDGKLIIQNSESGIRHQQPAGELVCFLLKRISSPAIVRGPTREVGQ